MSTTNRLSGLEPSPELASELELVVEAYRDPRVSFIVRREAEHALNKCEEISARTGIPIDMLTTSFGLKAAGQASELLRNTLEELCLALGKDMPKWLRKIEIGYVESMGSTASCHRVSHGHLILIPAGFETLLQDLLGMMWTLIGLDGWFVKNRDSLPHLDLSKPMGHWVHMFRALVSDDGDPESLSIRCDADAPLVATPEIHIRALKLVIAHELQHVLLDHSSPKWRNEIQADVGALALCLRSEEIQLILRNIEYRSPEYIRHNVAAVREYRFSAFCLFSLNWLLRCIRGSGGTKGYPPPSIRAMLWRRSASRVAQVFHVQWRSLDNWATWACHMQFARQLRKSYALNFTRRGLPDAGPEGKTLFDRCVE